ncbi:MAG: hypothetical protein ACUVR8_07960 [Acidobacteriota bacterium]
MTSLLLSLVLTGGLGATPSITADQVSAQSPAPTTKRKNRRSSETTSQKTTPKMPPEMPPMDDLPLGAQDLLMSREEQTQAPSTGKSNRSGSRRPLNNYDFDTPLPRGEGREETDEPAAEDPEEVWQRAVEEARRELREAQEEKQQQDLADSPMVELQQNAELRLIKARQALRRLLEEGRMKQYREQPTEGRP